ncbi:MAG: toprim domain-containing protein [Thermoplasmata archaeon]
MKDKDNAFIESVNKWVETINALNCFIIVEGGRDFKSLVELGVTNEIAIINKGIHLYEFIEQNENKMKGKMVIILTDWDKKGKELYDSIKNMLKGYGINDNAFYRKSFEHIFYKYTSCIEDAYSIYKKILEKNT